MTIVNTSKCSTATQLTKVRRKKIVPPFAVGRTFRNELGENKDRHTSCVLRLLSLGRLLSSLRTGVSRFAVSILRKMET